MADKEKRKKLKTFKADEKVVRGIINNWNPINFGGPPFPPEDEYDCLVHRLLSALYQGASNAETTEDILLLINNELQNHFGTIQPKEKIDAVSKDIINWWLAKKQ